MSVDAEDFLVFETYRDAEGHAFSKGLVSDEDKDSYDAVFRHLREAVAGAIARSTAPDELGDWTCKFGRDDGIQGQRPKDLWASIINRDSEAFSKFPQVYVIASERGVEVGFSVTIHEDDYYNADVKRKNRSIVPIVNARLPAPDSDVVGKIQDALAAEQGWIFAEKTRQAPASSFTDLPELIAYLKSGANSAKGGGAVCRILHFAGGRSTGGVPGQPALARFHELLGPSVIQALRDAFLAAQLGEAVLAAQPVEHDTDLVFSREVPTGLPPDVLHNPLSGGLFGYRFFQGGLGLHLRSFVTTTKPQPSLNHNLKSVPLVLTGDMELDQAPTWVGSLDMTA